MPTTANIIPNGVRLDDFTPKTGNKTRMPYLTNPINIILQVRASTVRLGKKKDIYRLEKKKHTICVHR